MTWLAARTLCTILCIVAAGVPRSAWAQSSPTNPSPPADFATAPSPAPEAITEAKRLFVQGSEFFQAKHFAEALIALRASHGLVPSPNSGLLIARCLRELSQPAEALEMYASVEAEARRRVAGGETKYARTAASAALEGGAVRAGLGLLRVHAPSIADVTISVDDVPKAVPVDGTLVLWHAPGEVRVSGHWASGVEQIEVVTVPAGGEVNVEIVQPPPKPAPPVIELTAPPTPTLTPRPTSVRVPVARWVSPVMIASGATAAVGFGVFVGFGLASHAEYVDLKSRCVPSGCSSAFRGEAATGERNQAIANVGLVVGSLAATALTIALIVRVLPRRASLAASTPRTPAFPLIQGLTLTW